MSYFFYNFIIILLSVIITPFYFLKVIFTDKYRKTWRDRLGVSSSWPVDDNIIWIHAASAGEVKTAINMINNIDDNIEEAKFIVTASTHSGYELASTVLKTKASVHMLPVDLPWVIGKVVKKINPQITVIIEPDIWPNFIKYTSQSGNLLMLNAWYKHKMIKKIGKIKGLLPRVIDFFDKITLQTKKDKKKFEQYVNADILTVTGNIKYDQVHDVISEDRLKPIKAGLKLNKKEPLFIAGSTHEDEEKLLLEVYNKLKVDNHKLVMLIAPRHIERADKVIKLCQKMNINAVKKTHLVKKNERKADVIILDTMGELARMYPLAEVTFIGGTLIDQGGHNMLEALAGGNPVLFGPYYYNFKEIFKMAQENGVGYKVTSEKELLQKVKLLLNDKKKLLEISRRASTIINDNKGALDKNVEIILDHIKYT